MSVLLVGCTSASIAKLKQPDPSNRAEVLIFRDPAHTAAFVTLTFGENKEALVNLGESEFASIYLNSGTYDFFVQARSADPIVITATLNKGDRKCLKAVADDSNFGRALIPFMMMSKGYLFTFNEIECPSNTELAKYSRVPIDYQTN